MLAFRPRERCAAEKGPMPTRYDIHPSIGIARVGNSPDSFYVAPDAIGGLPFECDADGNRILVNGAPQTVRTFKDDRKRVRRQAAVFTIFAYEDDRHPPRAVSLADADVERIEWTAHLANKKAAWYQNQELDGDLMLGNANSYAKRHVPFRNAHVTGEERRQALIIDPGPRTVRGILRIEGVAAARLTEDALSEPLFACCDSVIRTPARLLRQTCPLRLSPSCRLPSR